MTLDQLAVIENDILFDRSQVTSDDIHIVYTTVTKSLDLVVKFNLEKDTKKLFEAIIVDGG